MYVHYLKRAFDLTLATTLLAILAPLMLIAAIAIKCESAGPIIFRQRRVGFGGAEFEILKFRSMAVSVPAECVLLSTTLAANGLLLKGPSDPRVTRVGRILRRLSIDELPQLLNVLRGDMSLVGPRPLMPFQFVHAPEKRAIRSRVRPGITGVWQVTARDRNTSLEDMWEFDRYYIEHVGLRTDLSIVLRTLPAVFSMRGAV